MNTEIQEVQLNTYPAYKDSGVEWMGDIPEHWEVSKVKDLYKVINGATPSSSIQKYWDGEVNWVTPTDINNIKYIETSERTITELGYRSCGTTLVPSKSIILTTRAPIGKVVIASNELCTNQGCKSLVKNNLFIDEVFTYYYLSISSKVLNSLGTGTTFMELSNVALKNYLMPFPSLVEQAAIANFLDEKCAKIDAAVEIKQQQIGLLKDRRQIAIHQAVTQGLDKNVPMKDSGVEWIGEIPRHWEVKKVTHLFEQIGSGTTPTSGDIRYYEGNNNFLQTGDLNDNKVLFTKRTLKEKAFKDFTSLKVYPKGSLVMAMYGATIGKLGILEIESATNQACCVFGASKKILIEYFFQVLLAFRAQIISLGYGGGQPNISQELIRSLRFPIAPISEQQTIVIHLEELTSKIDSAISLYQQEIEKLKEYKTTLINSAVTGKIKVPGVN